MKERKLIPFRSLIQFIQDCLSVNVHIEKKKLLFLEFNYSIHQEFNLKHL